MRTLAAVLLALSLAAVAAADQDAWCNGDGWVPLPELEPGLIDLPDPALYAAQQHFERYFGAEVDGWACPAESLNVAADGCEQAGKDGSRFWLRLHLVCPENNESAEVEALVAVLPGRQIEVDMPRVVLAGVEQPPLLLVDPGSALYENPFLGPDGPTYLNDTDSWRNELVPLTQLMLEPPSDVIYAGESAQPCPEGSYAAGGECRPCSGGLPDCKQCRACLSGRACHDGTSCVRCASGYALSRDGQGTCSPARSSLSLDS